jgi:hypothetical protein
MDGRMRCLDCETVFEAIASWQVRCRRCYARSKREELEELERKNEWLRAELKRAPDPLELGWLQQENSRLQAEVAQLKLERARGPDLGLSVEVLRLQLEVVRLREAAGRGGLDRDFVRQLLQVAHPDKHNGSDLSLRVTKRLLAMKDS